MLDSLKYNIWKQKQKHKNDLEIYMKFGLKIGLLFFLGGQGYSEMKMKIKE